MQARDYRADIDVLRAFAVLAVVLYHFRIPFFGGGYVGVSIFFVISGYLITGIIKRKLENGTFSFAEFYENRVRRIFPALFFMVFCVMLFEWVTSVNLAERRDVYSSAKRVLLTIPNIYFYLNTNYFDPAADTMPLLHTWSLGVEEQFYFVFPLLLFLTYIYIFKLNKNKIIRLLSVLFSVSFVFSVIFVFFDQKFTFYMLPTRAWELLLGALLAYTEWTPQSQRKKVLCVCIGLFFMAVSVFGYTDNIYPGFWALFPCLGAFLYIAGGTGLSSSLSLITKNRILVFVGVISYSLYLWHWPLLVYYQNWLYRREIGIKSGLVLFAVIFAVSVFSWRFIEKPVRQKPVFKKHGVLWTSVACCFGIFMLFVNNLSFTLSDENGKYFFSFNQCPSEYKAENPSGRVLLMGDSHSKHLVPLIYSLSEKYHDSFLHVAVPLLGTYNGNFSVSEKKNRRQGESFLRGILEKEHFDTVFVAYRYDFHLRGVDIVRKNAVFHPLKSFDDPNLSSVQALFSALEKTVQVLKEYGVKRIYFVSSVPQAKAVVKDSANKLEFLFGYDTEWINAILGESREEFDARVKDVRAVLGELAEKYPDVCVLDPAPYFLNGKKTGYDVTKGYVCCFSDDDHLSKEGAVLLTPLFEPVFSRKSDY